MNPELDPATRKRVRRWAIALACVAVALYFAYIVTSVVNAKLGGPHQAPTRAPAPAAR